MQAAAARRLPALLEERPVAVDLLKDYDKGFSCVRAWPRTTLNPFQNLLDTFDARHSCPPECLPPAEATYLSAHGAAMC